MPPGENDNVFEVKMLMSGTEQNILSDFTRELRRSTQAMTSIASSLSDVIQATTDLQRQQSGRGVIRHPGATAADANPVPTLPPMLRSSGRGGTDPTQGWNYVTPQEASDMSVPSDPDGNSSESDAPVFQRSPAQDRLVRNAEIIGSERARRARDIPPFGTMTTQSMLNIASEFTAKHAFHTQTDPATGEQVPVFVNPNVDPSDLFDENGNFIRDEKGNIAGALDPSEGGVALMRSGSMASSLARVSGMLGGAAEAIPAGFAALTVARTIQSGLGAAFAPSRAGMQMGYDPGILGAGTRNYLGGMADAAKESLLGFNPYLGFGDAMAINSEINRLGYRGDTRSQMFNAMAGLQEHTGISFQDVGGMFDQSFRYGGTSIGEFVRVMEQVPAAAQAANMNVKAFNDQLQQVSSDIATRSGVTSTQVAAGIIGTSTATGLTPAAAGSLMNNDYLTIMGAARSGQNLGAYLGNVPAREQYQTGQGVNDMFQMFTGHPLRELPTNKGLQDLVRMMMWQNPQMFAGMNFQQLLQMANDPSRGQRTAASADITALSQETQFQDTTGNTMFQGVSLSDPRARAQFNTRLMADLQHTGVSQEDQRKLIDKYGMSASPDNISNEIKDARRLIQRATNTATHNANIRSTVEVTLAPSAQRIIQATLRNQNYETGTPTNDKNWTSEVGGAIHGAWDIGKWTEPAYLGVRGVESLGGLLG